MALITLIITMNNNQSTHTHTQLPHCYSLVLVATALYQPLAQLLGTCALKHLLMDVSSKIVYL